MYKNRLQELCQKKYWAMPRYSSNKVGPDHNPRFTASVIVNGDSFETAQFFKSSKEAQGEAARLAFEHFTKPEGLSPQVPSSTAGSQLPEGSSGASTEVNGTPIPNGMVEPKHQEVSEIFHSNGVVSSVTEDIEVKDLGMLYLCKSQLQYFAQRKNIQLPLYSCTRDGPPHALRFKATVTVDGQTFESPDFFRTTKEAENAAAKAALMSLSGGVREDEHGLYKTILQELTAKEGISLPVYKTICSGSSHMPTFCSTVELEGEIFSGKAAKTKKQAEMNAAKVALSKLNERKSNWMQDSVGRISFPQSCVFVDLPPKRNSQTTFNPAPSFSIQSPIETKGGDHENSGRSNQLLPSLNCQAPEAHKHIASLSRSSVNSDLQLNVGNVSTSNQIPKTGSKDARGMNSGKAREIAPFQSPDSDKGGIHDSIPSTRKSHAHAVLLNVDSPSSSTAMASKKSDMIYAQLRDPFPVGPSCTENGMSSSSTHSDCPDASDPPTGSPRGESGPRFLGNKIQVHPRVENMTLPKGATVLPFSDDEWVAAKLEFPGGERS